MARQTKTKMTEQILVQENKSFQRQAIRLTSKLGNFFRLKNFNILLVVLIILGGVFYIASINDLTVKGFKLQELKEQAYTKQSDLKEMENRAMELESYSYLSEKAEELGMVAISGEIAYLESGINAVAFNE